MGHKGSLWRWIVAVLGGMAVSLAVLHCHLWLSWRRCQKCLQSVRVHWQRGGPAKMARVSSLLVGPGQVWQNAVVGLPVGTSISCLMLHGSSCIGSHVGQSGQWGYCEGGSMKFFPVVCGCPTWRLWSQHAVIMLQDLRSSGPLIILPAKSICLAAIMFLTQGME